MTDPRTGMTRGYGFVRFTEFIDQQGALVEMQGYFLGSRAIRVSVATPKNKSPFSASTSNSSLLASPNKSPLQSPLLHHLDATNTTVFVGGLSAPIREDELRQYFQHFGEIVYVKIPPGKGCGFVQYVSRTCAELAIEQMNGYQIGNSRIRLSWGRSHNEKATSSFIPTQMLINQNILPSSLYQSVYPAISSVAQQDFMQNTSYSDLNFLPNDTTHDDFFDSLSLNSNNEKNRKVDWRLDQIYAQ